jgi:hypothetical protein
MKSLYAIRKYIMTFLIVTLLMLVVSFSFFISSPKHAQASASLIKRISHDTYTNRTSQHQTQVEPDTLSFGPMVVSAFQSGRFYAGGGSSGIAWASSFDAGFTWSTGHLPAITTYDGGPYARVSDSVVGYDLAHHTWLISSLAAKTTFDNVVGSTAVIVSRSIDGLHWSRPVVVSASGPKNNWDKDWIVCDQNPRSRFFGHCYSQWDDSNNQGQIMMSFSNNGGLNWSTPISPANQTFFALGGQPLVQPNGNVIVPIYGYDRTTGAEAIYSYMSTDGGMSWTNLVQISPLTYFFSPGSAAAQYRGGSLPSAEIDASGKVYVAWAGCYFEANCSSDDIVFSTSTDGTTWTALQRIPLDRVGSGVEHLTAGLAVDKTTAGAGAHLAVTYYYFPTTTCTTQPCPMYAGFASSINGGTDWSPSQTLTPQMAESWFANTDQGYMTGDYISTSIAANRGVTVIPVAQAPNGQQYNQAMYAASIALAGGSSPCDTLSSANAANAQAAQKTSHLKRHSTAN